MKGKPKKSPREKDLTSRYVSGHFDEDRVEAVERFSDRNKNSQHDKMQRTAALRAGEESGIDINALPVGRVVQVHSLYSEVEHEGRKILCVVRRTLTKTTGLFVIVGDEVRFREGVDRAAPPVPDSVDVRATPQGVIEQILPRRTVLTRTESFKGVEQHPIVANAQQMLIVASLREPVVKWGLIDRMIVAALSGGLSPIVCLNKVDLAQAGPGEELTEAQDILGHYQSIDVRTLLTSVSSNLGLDDLRDLLKDRSTVLAGHSGVGKSSLVRAIEPALDIRVGEISRYTNKGRHTTTSARRYPLQSGGEVIDTPGVKTFGLWGVTADNLDTFFPDVAAGTAPSWRKQSYDRIAASLA